MKRVLLVIGGLLASVVMAPGVVGAPGVPVTPPTGTPQVDCIRDLLESGGDGPVTISAFVEGFPGLGSVFSGGELSVPVMAASPNPQNPEDLLIGHFWVTVSTEWLASCLNN